MYSFAELCDATDYPFCYLLGVLKKWPSKKYLTADLLASEFEWLLNVEDQSNTPWQTRRRCDLTRKFVLPSAPLTMTPAWSPFPLAFDVMPHAIRHGRSEGSRSSAFAIFTPDQRVASVKVLQLGDQPLQLETPASDENVSLENIHAQHFLWLLNMTIARAVEMKKPVILIGEPGFGYEGNLERDMNGESKLRLLKAGYLYPGRVPQGARFAYLTDPEAREKRRCKMAQLEPIGHQSVPLLPGTHE